MAVPIERSITLQDKYPSVIDRYYTRKYVQSEGGNDVCLLFHSNKICVVTLAKSHAALTKGISKVDFKVGKKLDRSSNKVTGKGKKGAQCVNEKDVLCIVECKDGTVYQVMAGVKGKLVEVNEHLVEDPQLLEVKYETDGYIAVVLQKLGVDGAKSESSLTQHDYDKAVTM